MKVRTVSFANITVLAWTDMLGGLVAAAMMPYLTDVRKLDLTHAGSIMNLFDGFVATIPLAMCCLVDAYTGDYNMLVATSFAYSFGMIFLTTTTPRTPTDGNTQVVLFYVALALVVIGRSGYKTSIGAFYDQQLEMAKTENTEDEYLSIQCGVVRSLCCVAVLGAIGVIILLYVNSWSVRFGMSAGFTIFATLLFVSGSSSYYPTIPAGRLSHRIATIMQYVRMLPLLMTFVVGGVISSIRSSYLMEQANHLNNKLWIFKLPLPMLPPYYEAIKLLFTKTFRVLRPELRVIIAMLLSILGCIAAALVEVKRLGEVRSHGLIDKPEEQIPMSILWVIPQFSLLAAFDGVLESSSEEYLEDMVPGKKEFRVPIFSDFVVGGGTMCSSGFVHMLSKVTKRGGKPGWFLETLNQSRLDNYYWTLAALSAVTLVLYILYLKLKSCFPSMGECESTFDYESLETTE